jgi:hypothetical protein
MLWCVLTKGYQGYEGSNEAGVDSSPREKTNKGVTSLFRREKKKKDAGTAAHAHAHTSHTHTDHTPHPHSSHTHTPERTHAHTELAASAAPGRWERRH